MFPTGTAVSEISSIKCVKETIFEKMNDFEMRKRRFYEMPIASGQSNHRNRISLTTRKQSLGNCNDGLVNWKKFVFAAPNFNTYANNCDVNEMQRIN